MTFDNIIIMMFGLKVQVHCSFFFLLCLKKKWVENEGRNQQQFISYVYYVEERIIIIIFLLSISRLLAVKGIIIIIILSGLVYTHYHQNHYKRIVLSLLVSFDVFFILTLIFIIHLFKIVVLVCHS